MFKPHIKVMTNFLEAVLGKNIVGITLFPFGIYLKLSYLTRQKTINHESIHWQQQLEMVAAGLILSLLSAIMFVWVTPHWWILTLMLVFPLLFFYLWYVIEWFFRIFINGNKAYVSLSFEREAYGNAGNMDYLKTRKRFAWLKYMRKKE